MHIFLIIAGSILIVVAIGSMINRKSKAKELFTYGATESTSVNKLEELAKSISSDEAIGSGYFNKDVKISGTIYTDNPLKSKLAGVDCVWYSSEVKRVYEVERIERDD
ncbi:MAG: hypothetical protein ACOCV8_04525, partial [Spirochaetota bacterium]